MLPGEYVWLLGSCEDALYWRSTGLILRDCVLILLPGGRSLTAFLFRSSLDTTVLHNVSHHGVGGLNIDACRVPGRVGVPASRRVYRRFDDKGDRPELEPAPQAHPGGRWPSNTLLVHDRLCRPGVCVAGCPAQGLQAWGDAAQMYPKFPDVSAAVEWLSRLIRP